MRSVSRGRRRCALRVSRTARVHHERRTLVPGDWMEVRAGCGRSPRRCGAGVRRPGHVSTRGGTAMGLLDRLLGREPRRESGGSGYADFDRAPAGAPRGVPAGAPRDDDRAAIDRYRYLLRTAPPDAIEQAHAEAFAQLTPQQRREVLSQLSREVPASERPTSDDPRSLARMATRAELRNPGTLERSFSGGRGGMGAGMGMGGLLAGSLLAS